MIVKPSCRISMEARIVSIIGYGLLVLVVSAEILGIK